MYPPPLQERLLNFAAAVMVAAGQLPRTDRWSNVATQLNRCGTAPVAHYAEAQGAESKRDFAHKVQLCLKEMREAHVWLRMATKVEPNIVPPALVAECDELVAILVTIAAKAKRNARHEAG